MRSFKKVIMASNLILIDISFIISYPSTHAHFLNLFSPSYLILKFEL